MILVDQMHLIFSMSSILAAKHFELWHKRHLVLLEFLLVCTNFVSITIMWDDTAKLYSIF